MNEVIKDEFEEETADIDIEPEDDGDDIDDLDGEFELDENGDIIIPEEDDSDNSEDSEDNEDGEDSSSAEEESEDENSEEGDVAENKRDENGKDTDDSKKKEEAEEKPEVVEPGNTQPDEKDKRIADLERQLRKLESQSKDTLSKLGVETDDVMAGLVKLAAEADETTPEEYVKKRDEAEKNEEARRLVQKIEFEKKMKSDLAEVHAAFPETKKYNSVLEFPNIQKFGEFRDLGLTPKEAYIAANPDTVRDSVANAAKKQTLAETKAHLKTNVPKGSKDTSLRMSKKELGEYRDLFPELTDKERIALYKQTLKK